MPGGPSLWLHVQALPPPEGGAGKLQTPRPLLFPRRPLRGVSLLLRMIFQ